MSFLKDVLDEMRPRIEEEIRRAFEKGLKAPRCSFCGGPKDFRWAGGRMGCYNSLCPGNTLETHPNCRCISIPIYPPIIPAHTYQRAGTQPGATSDSVNVPGRSATAHRPHGRSAPGVELKGPSSAGLSHQRWGTKGAGMIRKIVLTPKDVREIVPAQMTRSRFDLGVNPWTGEDRGSIPGLKRVGDLTFTISNPRKERDLMNAWSQGHKQPFEMNFGGTAFKFAAHVLTVQKTSPIDGLVETKVTLRPTGPINVYEDDPRDPRFGLPKKEKRMIPKKMPKNLKRFYVGSNNLTADWTHGKLAGALQHAAKLVEKDGYEEVFVVEIKRVVRRKAQPVVVEPFK